MKIELDSVHRIHNIQLNVVHQQSISRRRGEGAESEAFELCKAPVGGGGGIGGPDWDIARDAGESAWRVPQGLSYFCSRPSAKKTIKRDGGRFKTVLLFLSDPV